MNKTVSTPQATYKSDALQESVSPSEFNGHERSIFQAHFTPLDATLFFAKMWKIPAIMAIVGLFIALSYEVVRSFLASSNSYTYTIQLTFNGIESNQYPDGSRFSLRDITAPSVLQRVYTENNLEEDDISLQEFAGAFQVVPFAENRNAIMAKYQTQFDERKATLAEIEANQNAMRDELRRDARGAATIIFADFTTRISDAKAAKIVSDTASFWTQYVIAERGVFKGDFSAVAPDEFDAEQLDALEQLNGLRLAVQRSNQLRNFIANLQSQSNGNRIIDAETRKNTFALINDVNIEYLNIRQITADWATEISTTGWAKPSKNSLFSSNFFDTQVQSIAEYLLAVDVLADTQAALTSNINATSDALDGDIFIRDVETGLNLQDLGRLSKRVVDFDLVDIRGNILGSSLARDVSSLRRYYNTRLSDLESEKAKLTSRLNYIDATIEKQQSQGPSAGLPGTLPGNEDSNLSGDSAFLNSLLELSGQSDRDAFTRTLVGQALNINERLVDLEGKIASIRADLAAFNDPLSQAPSNRPQQTQEIVESAILATAEKLQTYAAAVDRISTRLRIAREIFQIIENENSAGFDISFYLQDRPVTDMSLGDVLNNLKQVAIVANRLYEQTSDPEFTGERTFYQPVSNVEKSEIGLLGVRTLALSMLGFVLAGILGLLIVFALYIKRFVNRKNLSWEA